MRDREERERCRIERERERERGEICRKLRRESKSEVYISRVDHKSQPS
jgi:hypothetical protein